MAELKRTLGFWMTSAFIFLNLVNTGVFFGVQIGVAVAGIDSLIAWAILAAMGIYTGMCFAELTTMFPTAGGVYEFAKQAYGRFLSFEVGWVIWTVNNIATALLVVAAMEYMLPGTSHTVLGYEMSGTVLKTVCAILIILLLNLIAYRGAEESARLMVLLAIFTFTLLLLAIVPGVFSIHASMFTGFTWHWPIIILAAFLLSETFFGWESVSFMAEEIKNPSRTIPRAMILTTTFVALASLAVAIITMQILGVEQLAALSFAKPIIEVFTQLGFTPAILIFANLGIVMTFLGNAAGGIIGNPRLLMALSRDKLFIEQFEDIHPKYQTPYRGIIIQTVAAVLIVLVASGAYQRLLELVVAPSIILYASIIFLVPFFRWTRRDIERPYKTPFGSFLPLLLVAAYIGLLVIWALYDAQAVSQLRLLGSFLLFSIPIYVLLTYFYDPDVLINTINRFAIFNLLFENFLLPRRIRRQILEYIPDAKDLHIMELGAGVGSLTLHLAEHVGNKGKVYALDFSAQNIRILEKRMKKYGHSHVEVIHDPHLVNRVHPSVERVDIVVSVGNLSYIQDIQKVLRELYAILPHHGRICFVEYADMFWFLPNRPKWITRDEEIKQVFGEAGFSVNVSVKKGLFWNYVFIYGLKEKANVPYI